MRREHKEELAWTLLKLCMVGWLVLMFVGLTGCTPKPYDSAHEARTYVVAVHEGCIVHYTKTTHGPDVNWVRCGQESSDIQTQIKKSCGKNCTAYVTVPTLN